MIKNDKKMIKKMIKNVESILYLNWGGVDLVLMSGGGGWADGWRKVRRGKRKKVGGNEWMDGWMNGWMDG